MNAEAEGREAASRFRHTHGLGTAPLLNLIELIDTECLIDVAVVTAPAGEHGMTVFDPVAERAIIGVGITDNPMRLRSTLAHELGHWVLGDHLDGKADTWGKRTPTESRADSFARHLLLPLNALDRFDGEAVTEREIAEEVRRFRVSPHLAAIQFKERGFINQAVCDEFRTVFSPELASRHGWREEYDRLASESRAVRVPRRLVARAIEGYRHGLVSARTIATLRDVDEQQVIDELAEAGVVSILADPLLRAADLDAIYIPELDESVFD